MTTPLDEQNKLPRPFILRRLHSLLGLWLVIYLFEHLLINSQMALYSEDGGASFIRMVNQIHDLPFLKAIEIAFLGLPFLIHGIWGVLYLRTSKLNAHRTDGTTPALPQYKRNKAYSWQRITSWILLVGIIAHVVHMRFIDYPTIVKSGTERLYMTRLTPSQKLTQMASKLNVQLLNEPMDSKEVLAVSPNAGTAIFLTLRETFSNPLMVILYSILVIAAVYHAFNGVWTAMITWGITQSRRAQRWMRSVTTTLMAIVMFLGLIAAWGPYLTQ